MFAECDVDGSGSIEKAELKQLLQKLGQDASDERVDWIFLQMDVDGNGSINFFEFISRAPKRIQYVYIISRFITAELLDVVTIPTAVPQTRNVKRKIYDQDQIRAIRKLFSQFDKGIRVSTCLPC